MKLLINILLDLYRTYTTGIKLSLLYFYFRLENFFNRINWCIKRYILQLVKIKISGISSYLRKNPLVIILTKYNFFQFYPRILMSNIQ